MHDELLRRLNETKTMSIVGMCKNAGKTTMLNWLLTGGLRTGGGLFFIFRFCAVIPHCFPFLSFRAGAHTGVGIRIPGQRKTDCRSRSEDWLRNDSAGTRFRRSFLYFRISLRCSATMTRSSMG